MQQDKYKEIDIIYIYNDFMEIKKSLYVYDIKPVVETRYSIEGKKTYTIEEFMQNKLRYGIYFTLRNIIKGKMKDLIYYCAIFDKAKDAQEYYDILYKNHESIDSLKRECTIYRNFLKEQKIV